MTEASKEILTTSIIISLKAQGVSITEYDAEFIRSNLENVEKIREYIKEKTNKEG